MPTLREDKLVSGSVSGGGTEDDPGYRARNRACTGTKLQVLNSGGIGTRDAGGSGADAAERRLSVVNR
jgi:hypothetical protein